jgi:hypothetical protein
VLLSRSLSESQPIHHRRRLAGWADALTVSFALTNTPTKRHSGARHAGFMPQMKNDLLSAQLRSLR